MGDPDTEQTTFHLVDLPAADEVHVLTAAEAAMGPRLSPRQILVTYDSTEWERFIFEWANAISGYTRIKHSGGTGDLGLDVIGLCSNQGLEGEWDCFQCKHYADPLTPGDAYPEIAKILVGVVRGEFTLPRRYLFVAPKECGRKLDRLLSSPAKLRTEFVKAFDDKPVLRAGLSVDEAVAVRAFAESLDFSMFDSADFEEIIRIHAMSPHHLRRFGGQLRRRPKVEEPPTEPTDNESRYVAQLLVVYKERFGLQDADLPSVLAHIKAGKHLRRQREAFYSAEALRVFARDQVPPGTFEAFQRDIYDGVIETANRDHPSGYDRLVSVLESAVTLNLGSNVLVATERPRDRHGICHQLANDDQLTWLDGGA